MALFQLPLDSRTAAEVALRLMSHGVKKQPTLQVEAELTLKRMDIRAMHTLQFLDFCFFNWTHNLSSDVHAVGWCLDHTTRKQGPNPQSTKARIMCELKWAELWGGGGRQMVHYSSFLCFWLSQCLLRVSSLLNLAWHQSP